MVTNNDEVRDITLIQYNAAVSLVGQLASALDDLTFIDTNYSGMKPALVTEKVADVRSKVPTGIPADWKGGVSLANGNSGR